MTFRSAALLLPVLLLSSLPGDAALIIYTDKTAFLDDTGATSATGPLPDIGAVAPGFTVGSVSFTTLSGQFFIGIPGEDWSSLLPGADIAISNAESFRADLAGPVFSLGFDFHEPVKFTGDLPDDCNAPCFDSTFQVTLLSAGVPIPAGFFYTAPKGVRSFFGVWTDFSFDGVRIIETTNTIDNEYWGEFFTGSRPIGFSVAEPGSLVLLMAGLAGLGLRKSRS